jgi:hypothetical protein
MVNLDIFLWEETCLIYQKEKQSDSNRKFLWNWHHICYDWCMCLLKIFLWVHTVLLFWLVKAGFLHWILKQNELLLDQSFNVIQLYRCWERNLLIKKMISIFTLWIFHLYVAAFHQHLQMDYTSFSWNDVRLYAFCNPWSICIDCR